MLESLFRTGILIALFAFLGWLLARIARMFVSKQVIYEFQRALLYTDGKFSKILGPGAHWYLPVLQQLTVVDVRVGIITLGGQEVLTADNVGLKVSLSIGYKVSDPAKAVLTVQSYHQSMYALAQIALRNAVGSFKVDELLENRIEIGRSLLVQAREQALAFGVEIEEIEVKDVMFPGELKRIFSEVVRAQKEGQAALERARGESAALRNLANAAKLLDNNPALMNLRILQSVGQASSQPGGGATVVLGAPGLTPLPLQKRQPSSEDESN